MIASQAVIERRTGFSESGVVFVVEKHTSRCASASNSAPKARSRKPIGPHNGRVEIEQQSTAVLAQQVVLYGDRALERRLAMGS